MLTPLIRMHQRLWRREIEKTQNSSSAIPPLRFPLHDKEFHLLNKQNPPGSLSQLKYFHQMLIINVGQVENIALCSVEIIGYICFRQVLIINLCYVGIITLCSVEIINLCWRQGIKPHFAWCETAHFARLFLAGGEGGHPVDEGSFSRRRESL